MAVLFAAIGVALYLSMAGTLLDVIDTGLRFRAATIEAYPDRSTARPSATLMEPNEGFVQIASSDGRLLRSSIEGDSRSVLPEGTIARTRGPAFFVRSLPVVGHVRILALRVRDGRVAIVGASLSDRDDALRLLMIYLLGGGPLALAAASYLGWRVAGGALRPVERLRQEASAITVSGLERRLSVPGPDDEVRRLAETLNEMLDRLEKSLDVERRFLDTASHEIRTPLAILKAELDIALSRERAPDELKAVLESAQAEADHLVRLAEDLLVMARARGGGLPVERRDVSLRTIIDEAVARFGAAARASGVRIETDAPECVVCVDGMRVRQAVDNLVDNAIRYSSHVWVSASVTEDEASIVVEDDGPGFESSTNSAGLGLRIVRAIAEGHGGVLGVGVRDGGGASVVLTLKR